MADQICSSVFQFIFKIQTFNICQNSIQRLCCFVLQVFEGKPYYLHIVGNFKPVAASGQELYITFRSFRVNRLSFVAHVIDASQPPAAQLFLSKEPADPSGKRLEPPLFTLPVSLPDFDTRLASPDTEPEQWRENLEAAKLSIGNSW